MIRRFFILALASCFGAASALPAAADLTFANDKGGSVELYGHFSPSVLSVDDGVNTRTAFADNDNSSSRVGLNIRQDLRNDWTFRFRFETNLGFRTTSLLTNNPALRVSRFDWDREDLRHIDFQLRSKTYGNVFLGQGSMSGDGVAEFDTSGTTLAASVSVPDGAGGFEFTNAVTSALTGVDVTTAFTNFDASRRVRLRYDTPAFNGFRVSVSAGENLLSLDTSRDDTHYGAALTYENTFETGTKLEAGIAYERRDRDNKGRRADTERDDVYGSASVLLTNGLNFTLAAGQRETRTQAFGAAPAMSSPTGAYVYGKIGYIANIVSVGKTAFSIDYYRGENRATSGDTSESWSLAVVQTLPHRLEAYLGYRRLTYADTTGVRYNDMDAWLVGGRWRF